MRKRSLAREHALKILYQAEMTRRDMKTALDIYWKEAEDKDKTIEEFANRLVDGIQANHTKIDQMITTYATNWQLKRMAVIDRNVLRIGVYELLFAPDIPPKATINEAIELAKKYGDLESSKFVNGILDKLHKTEQLNKQG